MADGHYRWRFAVLAALIDTLKIQPILAWILAWILGAGISQVVPLIRCPALTQDKICPLAVLTYSSPTHRHVIV